MKDINDIDDNDDIDNIDENDEKDDNDDMVAPNCEKKVFITILPGTVFSSPGHLNVSACLSLQAN